jgi:hypothetical protein
MKSLSRTIALIGIAALSAAVLAAAVAPARSDAAEDGAVAAPQGRSSVPSSWNDYRAKNLYSGNGPTNDGTAYLDDDDDDDGPGTDTVTPSTDPTDPNANVKPPSVDTDDPNGNIKPPWIDTDDPNGKIKPPKIPCPPQVQHWPKPPGCGKMPPRRPVPPGVQWKKPSGGKPQQGGCRPPGGMSPGLFERLLANPGLVEQLMANPEAFQKLLANPEFLEQVIDWWEREHAAPEGHPPMHIVPGTPGYGQ